MENQIETLYIVISLLALLSGGLVVFFLRQLLLTKNRISNDEAQSLIQENQNRVQELQTDIQEYQETIQDHQTIIQKLQNQLKLKDKRSWQAGQNSAKGGVAEFLGYLGLSITQKFDILCLLFHVTLWV